MSVNVPTAHTTTSTARRINPQKKAIVTALKQCADDYSTKILRQRDYDHWREAHPEAPDFEAINRVFRDWRGAHRAAGLKNPKGRNSSNPHDRVLRSVKDVSEIVGEVISQADYERVRKERPDLQLASVKALKRHFGSFHEAVSAAGCRPVRILNLAELSDEELIGFVRQVCRREGRPLSVREYDAARDPGTPTARNLTAHFERRKRGRWPELLAAAGYPPEK